MATTIQTQSTSAVQRPAHSNAGSKPSVAQYAKQKADKALGPKVEAGLVKDIEGGSYDKFVTDMQGLSPEQRLKALSNLREKHTDDYIKVLDAIRDHKISDDNLKTGVAIDRIKDTEWSNTQEGKDTLKQLEKQYASGNIHVVPKKQIDKEERAMGATPADASINIAKEVMDSPDAAAAVIAHEGMHSMHDATNTKGKTMVDEETAGNMVMAKVWTQLQEVPGFKKAGIDEEASLDKTASHYSPKFPDDAADMKKYVSGAYKEFYASQKK